MPGDLPGFEKADYLGRPDAGVDPQRMVSGNLDGRDREAKRGETMLFTQALLYGVAAAIVGSILYASFTIVTHIEIGYLAIGVGYLVGKAMLYATGGRGGRKYQIAAVALTYLSVSMAAVPEILWHLRSTGTDLSHISMRGALFLARYGVSSPFLELKSGLSGFIGLFILFIGIRAGWGLTAGNRQSQAAGQVNG